MLKRLTVKSFAIIEDITIDFSDKMTVLTGQTGAGKSLIIDTISLLLGARADTDMVRYGDDFAYILGEFTYSNKKIDQILSNYQIPLSNEIKILRQINTNGKNTIKINDVVVSLNLLKQIGVLLADIHIQHDTYSLINPDNYLQLIDPVDDDLFNSLFNDYLVKLSKYNSTLKNYESIIKSKKSSEEKLEFLKYQKEELSNLNLKVNEDEIIEEQITKMNNYDKIFNSLVQTNQYLSDEYLNADNVLKSANLLSKITSYDKDYTLMCEKLNDIYYILDDVKIRIKDKIDNLDFDQFELNQLNDRLNIINQFKKKYKLSVNEIIDYYNKLSFELELITNYDQVVKDQYNNLCNEYKLLCQASTKLTDYRKRISKKIEEEITKECQSLDLPNTTFIILFNEVDHSNPLNNEIFTKNGVDRLDFLISLNLGEPVKSLHKTASGGEMSRIMLAFKSYFSKTVNLSLMIFDEIDSGVSGETALKIATKLKSISKNTQLLCITHLAQVAATGDHHLYIYKEEVSNRTTTRIKKLDDDERVLNIAKMINGEKISKFSLEHAKELLESLK